MATFDLSGLSTYVKQNALDLILKSTLKTSTAKRLNVMTGVKYKSSLNIVTSTPVLQDGEICNFTPQGITTVTQRQLEVGSYKINKEWCAKELRKYFLAEEMKVKSGKVSAPIEQIFLQAEIDAVRDAVESLIWTSSKPSGQFNGLKKIFTSDVTNEANDNNTNEITISNVVAVLQKVYMKAPTILKKYGYIMVPANVFYLYWQALANMNMFHYDPNNVNPDELPLIGSNAKVVRADGFTYENQSVVATMAIWDKEVFLGVDGTGDMDSFVFDFDAKNDSYYLKMAFNLGVQIAFPQNCVKFTLA